MNEHVQFRRKLPRLKYTEKIAAQMEAEKVQLMQKAGLISMPKAKKPLDGVLLMHSCRVRNPYQAIRSKLSSEGIVDVRQEDLIYFKNLTHLDLSDNRV